MRLHSLDMIWYLFLCFFGRRWPFLLQAHPQPNPTSPTSVVFVFVFARLAGFDFNVAFFLGLAFAWVLPWLWFLLLDLVHLRHFTNQVAARFVFKSLPGFPLPLFLLAQLLLHLLPRFNYRIWFNCIFRLVTSESRLVSSFTLFWCSYLVWEGWQKGCN